MSSQRAGEGGSPPALAGGLVALLVVATWGEGGAEPLAMLVWHGLLVGLVLAVLLTPAGPRSRGVPASAPAFGFILFAALALLSGLFVPYGYAAWLLFLELGSFFAVAVLAARCGRELQRWLVVPLLAVALVESAMVLWTSVAGARSRPAGTFLNTNHLAAWLVAVMLLVLSRTIIAGGARKRRTLVGLLLLVPLLAALVLTGSRGGVLALAAGMAAFGAMRWSGVPRRWRVGISVAGALTLVLAAVVIGSRVRIDDPFQYHRVRIWRASLQSVLSAPWSGSGPGQFSTRAAGLQFADGEGPLRYDRSFSTTHSDLLRVPCEFGWPGCTALLIAIWAAVRELRRRRRTPEWDPASDGAVAALVALGAQASVENLSQRPAVYLLAAALVGTLLSTNRPDRAAAPLAPRVGLAGVLLLAFVVGDVGPYRAWKNTRGLQHGRLGGEQTLRVQEAIDLNPIHPEYWMLLAFDEATVDPEWDAEAYSRAREAAEHAVRLDRSDARMHRLLARLEARACRTLFRDTFTRRRAHDRFRIAGELAPTDPFIPIELAGFLLDTGDLIGARRAAERALSIEPESVLPRLLLAEAVLDSADDRAVRKAEGLLREAARAAERNAAIRDESPYARELLRPRPEIESRIRDKISALNARVRSGMTESVGAPAR